MTTCGEFYGWPRLACTKPHGHQGLHGMDIVIMDDPLGGAPSNSPERREKLKQWMSESFQPRELSPPEVTSLARVDLISRLTGILSHAWATAITDQASGYRWTPEEVDEATEVVRLLLKRASPEVIAEARALLKVR